MVTATSGMPSRYFTNYKGKQGTQSGPGFGPPSRQNFAARTVGDGNNYQVSAAAPPNVRMQDQRR